MFYNIHKIGSAKPRIIAGLMLVFLLSSCIREKPWDPTPYTLNIPAEFPEMMIPENNPLTVEGVKLGRMLYYDNILSTNGLSCNSCHDQLLGFSVPGPGPNDMEILPHINLGWSSSFGWTGGEALLDHVPLADLEEGNIFLEANNDSILVRFERHAHYPRLFSEAFGKNVLEMTVAKRQIYIARALGQFIRTQISGDSKFDFFKRGEASGALTQSEFNGYAIFFSEKGDCFHCHGAPLFTDYDFHNNGIDSVFAGLNIGRFGLTGNAADLGHFKTPTLRNIGLTTPYMHDGRFQTLAEVIEFYDAGVNYSGTLDPVMSKPGKEYGLGLTVQEKLDLEAFLLTLTDQNFIVDTSLASPF